MCQETMRSLTNNLLIHPTGITGLHNGSAAKSIGQRRIHGCVVHIDIIQGKIWIQHDGTNRPVAEELLEAGVPSSDIILGFHPPQVRQYTDFGVA